MAEDESQQPNENPAQIQQPEPLPSEPDPQLQSWLERGRPSGGDEKR
jgi:hypothetical protein